MTRWARIARCAFLVLALAALWNTLRHAELGRAARLVAGIGAPVALVAVPWLLAVGFLLFVVLRDVPPAAAEPRP
jgi:hypothetical protein